MIIKESPCVNCQLRKHRKGAKTFNCKWTKICKKYLEWCKGETK
jgi:hypothetical protein